MKEKEIRAAIKNLDDCLVCIASHAALLAIAGPSLINTILRCFASDIKEAKAHLEAALAEKGGSR